MTPELVRAVAGVLFVIVVIILVARRQRITSRGGRDAA